MSLSLLALSSLVVVLLVAFEVSIFRLFERGCNGTVFLVVLLCLGINKLNNLYGFLLKLGYNGPFKRYVTQDSRKLDPPPPSLCHTFDHFVMHKDGVVTLCLPLLIGSVT